MKKCGLLLVALLLVGTAGMTAYADEPAQGGLITPLRNQDVLNLVTRKVAPEAIINLIKVSPCNFDIFPPVLQDLARRGVPAEVLRAMIDAPYGPPADDALAAAGGIEAANELIYHYAEQLKQYSLATSGQGRRNSASRPRVQRARAPRPSSRRRL